MIITDIKTENWVKIFFMLSFFNLHIGFFRYFLIIHLTLDVRASRLNRSKHLIIKAVYVVHRFDLSLHPLGHHYAIISAVKRKLSLCSSCVFVLFYCLYLCYLSVCYLSLFSFAFVGVLFLASYFPN
jgi:hypothetical protein